MPPPRPPALPKAIRQRRCCQGRLIYHMPMPPQAAASKHTRKPHTQASPESRTRREKSAHANGKPHTPRASRTRRGQAAHDSESSHSAARPRRCGLQPENHTRKSPISTLLHAFYASKAPTLPVLRPTLTLPHAAVAANKAPTPTFFLTLPTLPTPQPLQNHRPLRRLRRRYFADAANVTNANHAVSVGKHVSCRPNRSSST